MTCSLLSACIIPETQRGHRGLCRRSVMTDWPVLKLTTMSIRNMVSDRQLNMVICRAVTAVWQNRQLFTYRHTRNKTLIHETSQVWIPKNTLDNMIKWIQDIARSLKLHPGLEIFFANLEENSGFATWIEKFYVSCENFSLYAELHWIPQVKEF